MTWLAALASLALLCQREGRLVSLTAVSFSVLLFGLAAEPSLPQRILSSRLLLIGGEMSYGMYLLQWPCKTEINLLCDRLHMGSLAMHFFLGLIALLALSTAGFYLVEHLSRKLIRAFFAAPNTDAARRRASPHELGSPHPRSFRSGMRQWLQRPNFTYPPSLTSCLRYLCEFFSVLTGLHRASGAWRSSLNCWPTPGSARAAR